ncbi:MAG: hypothetical protein OXH52_20525 [Gammaproteobacteria bacterium]|nr:hypothetical protein [Gammaproteobacteria bacterium]
MIRLALDLTSREAEILDSIVRGDLNQEPDDRARRVAVAKLVVDRGARMREAVHREEPEAIHRERLALREALEAERASRRRERDRHAAVRRSLRNAAAAVARLRESRARYRDLGVRVEAALLRSSPRTTSTASNDASAAPWKPPASRCPSHALRTRRRDTSL